MGKDDLQVKGKCYYESVIHGVKGEKLHWSKVNFLNWLFVSLVVVIHEEAVVALLWQHSNKFDEHLSDPRWS